MSNYDLLKETKTIYEYINNLMNKSGLYIDENTIKVLNQTKDIMGNIYSETHEKMKNNNENYNLEMDLECPHCSNKVEISDLIDYDYLCNECDENLYICEGNLDFKWYIDDNGDLKLNQDFDIGLGYDSNKNRLLIATEYSSGAKYDCKTIADLKKAIGSYASNYLLEDLEYEDEL